MKRFAAALMAGVCVVAGALRWVDLVRYTDPATGFCTWGSHWVRYVVYMVLLALLAMGSLVQSDRAPLLGRCSAAQGGLCVFAGLLFLAAGGVQLLSALGSRVNLALGVLLLITGVWMLLLGRNVLAHTPALPEKNAFLGVAGTLSFLLLAVLRYAQRPSGLVRVGITLQLLDAMFQMLFAVTAVRAAFLPERPGGRRGFFLGFAAFLGGTCLGLPYALWQLNNGLTDLAGVLLAAALGAMGLVGLAAALHVAGAAQTAPEPNHRP